MKYVLLVTNPSGVPIDPPVYLMWKPEGVEGAIHWNEGYHPTHKIALACRFDDEETAKLIAKSIRIGVNGADVVEASRCSKV